MFGYRHVIGTIFYTDHAEVSQFDPAAGGVAQEDILWFEVSVDKTKRVQVGQSAAQLGHDPLTTVLIHTDLGRKRERQINGRKK